MSSKCRKPDNLLFFVKPRAIVETTTMKNKPLERYKLFKQKIGMATQ